LGTIEIRVEAAMISTNSNEGQARDPLWWANAVLPPVYDPVATPRQGNP
jgi:hypothetical protein